MPLFCSLSLIVTAALFLLIGYPTHMYVVVLVKPLGLICSLIHYAFDIEAFGKSLSTNQEPANHTYVRIA